ncbi:MAG: hypothetical protein HS107_05620 [Thermoflexaceae bacterium]|nr:hypothetical protein [Thermoflexaceae bacterium]
MRRFAIALAGLVLAIAAVPSAAADEPDRVTLSATSAIIGQQLSLTVEVFAPRGATVEPDPIARSWGTVELVRVVSRSSRDQDGGTLHVLEMIVAPFWPGDVRFAPGIIVLNGPAVESRTLPAVSLAVNQTLSVDEPDELTPLPAPRPIGGAESPLLRPAIAAGGAVAAALLYLAGFTAVRRWRTRARPGAPSPAPLPPAPPDLATVEAAMHTDPASAYRDLAASVRAVLAGRYGIPAAALTAAEITARMEHLGLDRWQARLVSGLLDECDAVIYAGYRPAAERRLSDLNMAREIVEGGV